MSSSLYAAVKLASQIATEMSGKDGQLAIDRADCKLMQGLGWCSWDSLGISVTADDVVEAVRSLTNAGLQIGWVIVDDGWQDVDGSQLKSCRVAERFGDTESMIKSLKEEFGVRHVLAWHTVAGYWNGLCESFDGKSVVAEEYRSRYPAGLMAVAAEELRSYWNNKPYRLPAQPADFFEEYYSTLKEIGFDGVKVDGQSFLEGIGGRRDGRVGTFLIFRTAMETAAEKYFDGLVINCMACVNDAVGCSGSGRSSAVWRTSDDHEIQGNEETEMEVAQHLWANATNALWLGEQFIPDWDMFRSHGKYAKVHTAARAMSGGPIYISDGSGMPHDENGLASVFSADGVALSFMGAAQPCESYVFDQPTRSKRAYLIWNENAINSAVAAFNLNVETPVSVVVEMSPNDSGVVKAKCKERRARYGVYGFHSGFHGIMRLAEKVTSVVLEKVMDFEIFAIAPVIHLEDNTEICLLGDVAKMNAGAVIESICSEEMALEVSLRHATKLSFWSSKSPSTIFLIGSSMTTVPCDFEDGIHSLSVPMESCKLMFAFD